MPALISVTVDRPSDNEPVLVSVLCTENPPTRVWLIAAWIAEENRWADACDDVDPEASGYVVTHWVPLPEHPPTPG